MMILLDDEYSESPTDHGSDTILATWDEIVSEQEVSLHAFTNNSNL